jgi:prepilin-type N-terminal cleavage/methylation domain-containing protein
VKKEGFTLVECLAALVIAALIVMLLSFQMKVIKSSCIKQNSQPLDWYLCLSELESVDHHFMIEEVSSNQLRLWSKSTGLTYELHSTDRLYLSCVGHGGYMLIFRDLAPNSVTFSELSGSRVEIRGQRKNGQGLIGVVKFYGQVE